jgi:hypothetical protein
MRRRLVLGVVVVLACAFTASAVAADVPRATLAKKADQVCTSENAKLVTFKSPLPVWDDPNTATAKQIKASAGWLAESLVLVKEENARIFALGTPSEPAARTAWNRWHTLVTTVAIPMLTTVAASAKRGDVKAFRAAFASAEQRSAGVDKLIRGLGVKVCQFGG